MILLSHIVIAFASLGYSVYLFFFPTKARMNVSYVLLGLTVASGTVLIVSSKSHMLETCGMGLFYVGLTTFGIVSAKHKLATEMVKNKTQGR